MGERTRVSAARASPGWVDPRDVWASCRGPLSTSRAANYAPRTTNTATIAQKTNTKNQNTPSELHSAPHRVSGVLQVVPIETASPEIHRATANLRPRQSR